MNKIKSVFSEFRHQLSPIGIFFVFLSRIIFILSCFLKPQTTIFSLVSFFLTYLISFCHIISKEGSFLKGLSHRITPLICFSSLISCFFGKTMGVLAVFPDYDILMSAVTGVVGTVFGYYVTISLTEIKDKRDCAFVASSALFISGTVVFFREMLEFFSDYLFGTNFVHAEQIGDEHWFFRLFGVGSNIPQQRPLYDTDEDMLVSLLFSVFTALICYLLLKKQNSELFKKEKNLSNISLKEMLSDKIYTEVDKIKNETNIYDLLAWWLTRAAMIYAVIFIENNAERVLIAANLLGTFAITLLHLVFPKESFFSKINYRLQSWICLLVFTGSYMGNFIFVYNNLPRFDLFLHFISGPIIVAGGYYIAKIFIKPDSKHNLFIITLFSFCVSCFIMPAWEVFEFLGDFLFGSANQGFYWAPPENSFFFKIFGHGVGNTMLYYLFDTVYDVLLALLTTVISTIWLYINLLKELSTHKTATEEDKIAVNC